MKKIVLDRYTAVMKTEDGRELTIHGTIMQCANWADNMIRQNAPCTIQIIREDGKQHA